MPDFVPDGDAPLLGFAQNYSTVITGAPTAVGLTAPIATTLSGLVSTYDTKLSALDAPENRNPIGFLQKSEAKRALVDYIRTTARVIQACMTVTDEQRTELRLPIRDVTPTPAEPITETPALKVIKVQGRNIRIQVRDASGTVRGKLPAADGAIVYSFVGDTPPAGVDGWVSEGPITKDSAIIAFDSSVPVGAKVFFAAQWFNTKGVGPGCTPVAAVIGAEGSLAA